MFLHTWLPHPILLYLGPIHLRWYGLLMAAAALLGIWVVQRIARQYQLDRNRLFDLSLIVIIVGFISARLYHVLNEWAYYHAHPGEILKVWNGGLAIHGAVIGGLIAIILMSRRWKWDAWLVMDVITPALALGQAIGRWGNYFNQELFGRPTNLPWGIPIEAPFRPANYSTAAYFHPTFLYESLGLLVVFIGLWWLHQLRSHRPNLSWLSRTGAIALIYLLASSLVRFGVETLRIDRTPIISGLRLPLLVSAIIALLTIVIFIIRIKPHPHAA